MKKLFLLFLLFSTIPYLTASDPAWIRYPAISPDGTRIAFSYMGDLFTVASSGGTAVPLTRHQAYDYRPIWSPDGSWIAFASDRFGNDDIFVMPSQGGKPQRLTFHSSYDYPSSWSPDGNYILFSSSRMDTYLSTLFPSRRMTELYKVSLDGKLPERILTTPAEDAVYDDKSRTIYYHDRKGLENKWRKHHTSADARDIWKVDLRSGKHTQLTEFKGEDRSPQIFENDLIYFLSERSGSFNVWKMKKNGKNPKQVTFYQVHPVRFLSQSDDGTICYAFRGDLYILPVDWTEPVKVDIDIYTDLPGNETEFKAITDGATEFSVSPDGKEIALIVRGEIFVTSTDYTTTRRITSTAEQERSVSFSHDGRKLLYAGERNGSWNLYQSEIVNDDDHHFVNAREIIETPVLVTDSETFQPAFSPDDSLIAYLNNRDEIRVLNINKKNSWTIIPADMNYSYSDGDLHFEWSPDGLWLAASYLPSSQRWVEDIALISVDGKKIINISESGYYYWSPRWSHDGSNIYAFSNELGMRSHGSWGSQTDIFAFFTSDSTYDNFLLSKEEAEALEKTDVSDDDSSKDGDTENKEKTAADSVRHPIRMELEGFRDRRKRLTVHSSQMSDGRISPDGKYLVYLAKFEKGYDLWKVDLREHTPSLVTKLGASHARSLYFDKEGTHVFLLKDNGNISRIDIESGDMEPVSYSAEMELNYPEERAYMFEHVWRQMKEKFYSDQLHNVDWDMMKTEYRRYLPDINNNRDFSELLSEMLGEMNASHTGCYYRNQSDMDQTYSLGLFLSPGGDQGILVDEVIHGGPCDKFDLKIAAGQIIESIDGNPVGSGVNYFPFLNRIKDHKVRLSMLDPGTGDRWEEFVRPVNQGTLFNLEYNRWIENNRVLVDSLSHGKLGYAHVRGMNDASFRKTFAEIFGRQVDKDALIIDTRWNGGGWLHDDLALLLSGTDYSWQVPRGKLIGKEPQNRWTKPVVVVMGEANYSDAHFFPYAFTALKIGKTVGMPIPGTATAVWWETLQDPSLVFGIPQVGVRGTDGNFLENHQLEPDIKIKNDPESISSGRDKQIEKAVEVLLKDLED